jgi:hypothetical protein
MTMRQAINFKYVATLLSLVIALNVVPAAAQTNKKAKKPAAKAVVKKPAKTAAKKTVTPNPTQQKANAKSVGDAAAKAAADTVKRNAKANNPGNLSEEIVVTTAYKPVLADAVKIRLNPDLSDKTPFKAPLTYFPIDKRLELNSGIKPLEAMKRPAERDTNQTNNYIKAGVGNLKTTYAEAYFANSHDEALQVGGFLKHLAQNGSLYNQNTENDAVGAFIKTIGKDVSFTARLSYNYNGNYFYGYDLFNPPSVLQVNKQHFSTIGGEVELVKNFKDVDNDFTYALKLKGYSFSNAFQAKESNVVLSGFLNQTIGQFYAGLSGSMDLSTQQDSLYNINNSLLRLNPYIKLQGDFYKIDAGINIVDQFGTTSNFYIFPAAKVELQVIPKYLRLFVEAKGDVNKTSLYDFSIINPFLGKDINITNSVDQLDISAGLKGTIAAGLGFKVFVFRNSVKNMPLFVSNFNFATGYNRFNVIYDPGSSRVNGLNGELDLKASADLDIFGRVEFKDYQMATLAEPWNLPKFKLTAGTVIHVSDKVTISGSFLVRGSAFDPRPTVTGGTIPTTVSSFTDISAGFDYKVTNRFSIFVHANNLLNSTNQTWLYYPDYGFNIFGGIGFSF